MFGGVVMKLRRSIALSVAAGAAILMAAPSAASAAPAAPTGTRSLAAVLTANGNGQFDGNPFDYDIVTQAVLAVVGAKPASPVGLPTTGDVALTAFLPPDFAFRDLVRQLTGRSYASGVTGTVVVTFSVTMCLRSRARPDSRWIVPTRSSSSERVIASSVVGPLVSRPSAPASPSRSRRSTRGGAPAPPSGSPLSERDSP